MKQHQAPTIQMKCKCNYSDQSNKKQQSKDKNTVSGNMTSCTPIMCTSLTKTQNVVTESANKSSQTDYFEAMDPCANCSKLLMSAAEFLTKLELNYGSTPTTRESNLSNFSRSISTTRRTNVGRYAERKKNNQELVTLISGSTLDNKVKSVVSSTHMSQVQRKEVAPFEDAITPLDWVQSSRSSAEEQKKTISELKNRKSKEKKPETNNIVKNAIKAEPQPLKNRESGKGKKEIVEDNSTKLDATVAHITTPEKMRTKLEKTDEVTVIPKSKSVYGSDKMEKSKRKEKEASVRTKTKANEK